MGLLSEDKPSNEYTPKDFSNERTLRLQSDYYLSNEMNVVSL
jgi:hypothetical protein